MTLQDIYKKCKCWMYEKQTSTIYDDYIVEIANKVLVETYEENNMMRMFKGKLPFTDMASHLVKNLSDNVDYEDEYCLNVIPKGIDASFLMDDDLNKMSILETEYNNARVENQPMVSYEKVKELTEKANAS